MKFQSLFALAALGSGTLAFPAWPHYFSKGDNGSMLPPYPKSTQSWIPTGVIPSGVFPTGVFPTGIFPTGAFPPGGFSTGSPKYTGPHGTGHHKSVYPTDKPILPRHKSHSFTGGFPMPTGSLPPMPSDDPILSSLKIEHESYKGPHPTGGPFIAKRGASAPFPSEPNSGEKTDDCSSEKHAHKTGHQTGAHPRPTGVKPSGAVGYPKNTKQY